MKRAPGCSRNARKRKPRQPVLKESERNIRHMQATNHEPPAQPPANKRELTIQDVASELGITPRTVRNWIRNGTLPARRIGPRLVRIRRDDLVALDRPIRPGHKGGV